MKRTGQVRTGVIGMLAFLLAGSYSAWVLLRPLPDLVPETLTAQIQQPAADSALQWPQTGQSAVGIVGSPILETHGVQSPVPTASTAKVITALVVLDKKPLAPGQAGPVVTLTAKDVDIFNAYVARSGSVVPVQAGEQISQYQMLQAVMLPSANNMADSLAIWAFGSLEAYAVAANDYLKQQELYSTRVGTDASGLSPTTTSTAGDLVRLGKLAMQHPVLAEIAGQSSVNNFPVANTITNTNFLLGNANIIGLKTGTTDEAGGVFISASRATVNGKSVIIVTSLVGAPDRLMAINGSLPLIQSAQSNFKPVTVIKAGTVVGHYAVPWGGSVPAVASKNLTLTTWNGDTVPSTTKLKPLPAASAAGQRAGSIEARSSVLLSREAVPIHLKNNPPPATVWWRLTHPI